MCASLLFKQEHWAGLTDGTITVAFRRWQRPNARRATRVRFVGGYLMVDDVRVVDESAITKADARKAGFVSLAALQSQLAEFGKGDLYRVAIHRDGEDERVAWREDDDLSDEDIAAISGKLARLDKASTRGPWTATTLSLIVEHPGVRALDSAVSLGLETLVFKRDVRKLKALGLTESLKVGYRISPRGLVLLVKLPPLILDRANRLYLYRYWMDEKRVASYLINRSWFFESVDMELLWKGIQRWFEKSEVMNPQQIGALIAVCSSLCLITGGPGTGKTSLVVKILALLLEQARGKPQRIALAAPTGKAAARLKKP